MNCPECKLPAHPVTFSGGTGVVAPDGYAETQEQNGYQCGNCGAIFEEEEEEGEGEE